MNRRILLLITVILYIAAGAAAFVLFSRMHIPAAVSGTAADVRLQAPAPSVKVLEASTEAQGETEESAALPETLPETLPEESEAPEEAPIYTFTATHADGRLFIRADADISAEILGFLSPGDTGDVLDLGGDWAKITYGDLTGYVFKQYLELKEIETGNATAGVP